MANAEQQAPVQQDENQLIAERRAKLAEWRKTGNAFPNDFQRENTAIKLHRGRPAPGRSDGPGQQQGVAHAQLVEQLAAPGALRGEVDECRHAEILIEIGF